MKKILCMVALSAISFGTVLAHGAYTPANADVTQQDTVKKKRYTKTKRTVVKKHRAKKDTTTKM